MRGREKELRKGISGGRLMIKDFKNWKNKDNRILMKTDNRIDNGHIKKSVTGRKG